MSTVFDFVFKSSGDKLINDTVVITKTPANPLFVLGYHYFYNKTLNKLNVLDGNKIIDKRVFLVLHPYYPHITNMSTSDKETDIHSSLMAKFKDTKTFETLDETPYDYVRYLDMWHFIHIHKPKDVLFVSQNELIGKAFEHNKVKVSYGDKKGTYDTVVKIDNTEFKNKTPGGEEINIYNHIIETFMLCTSNLKNGGMMLCNIYQTMTLPTIKLLVLLEQCFEKVSITKPESNFGHSSESYLVCEGYQSSKAKKVIDVVSSVVKLLKGLDDRYLNDLFDPIDLKTMKNYTSIMEYINDRTHKQILAVNELAVYLNESNFFGDKYHHYKQRQLRTHAAWIKKYM